mmetsp:Transcript_18182/g.32328  ORF Transcript_18182/g.32328 Transcript_18182/m.32328 type:complete len:228 (-) Transcript_18182:298-981(-)
MGESEGEHRVALLGDYAPIGPDIQHCHSGRVARVHVNLVVSFLVDVYLHPDREPVRQRPRVVHAVHLEYARQLAVGGRRARAVRQRQPCGVRCVRCDDRLRGAAAPVTDENTCRRPRRDLRHRKPEEGLCDDHVRHRGIRVHDRLCGGDVLGQGLQGIIGHERRHADPVGSLVILDCPVHVTVRDVGPRSVGRDVDWDDVPEQGLTHGSGVGGTVSGRRRTCGRWGC